MKRANPPSSQNISSSIDVLSMKEIIGGCMDKSMMGAIHNE
jgi:hypothetical protein